MYKQNVVVGRLTLVLLHIGDYAWRNTAAQLVDHLELVFQIVVRLLKPTADANCSDIIGAPFR